MTALTLIGPKGQIEYLIGALHVYRRLSFSFTLTNLFTTFLLSLPVPCPSLVHVHVVAVHDCGR